MLVLLPDSFGSKSIWQQTPKDGFATPIQPLQDIDALGLDTTLRTVLMLLQQCRATVAGVSKDHFDANQLNSDKPNGNRPFRGG